MNFLKFKIPLDHTFVLSFSQLIHFLNCLWKVAIISYFQKVTKVIMYCTLQGT